MNAAETKRRIAELEEYYKKLYDQDAEVIKEEAMQYAENDVQRAKDYIAGYMASIKQPHTRIIRLITIYVMDFVPYFKKHPDSKNIVTRIREIFRQKRYPDGLFDPKDPSKRVSDEIRKSRSSKTSETSET